MNTLIITTSRIIKEGDSYYIDNGLKITIERYRNYFGKLTLFGMDGSDKGSRSNGSEIIDGVTVRIMGRRNELFLGKANHLLHSEIPKYDFLILRVPSIVGHTASKIALKNKIPYLVEVIGDAFGTLWYHSFAGKLLAHSSMLKTRKTVLNADYALYVSKRFLQSKYPCKNKSAGISDCVFEPPSEAIIDRRMHQIECKDYTNIVLMNAAAIDVKYKGQEYVIKAIPLLNDKGIRVRFYVVGNGSKSYLLSLAKKLGVANQVIFTGGVSHDDVIKLLDRTDFYIQPSLTEGFGRSVVEGLSRGCICIGTMVGGIPELIAKDYLTSPKSEKEIYEKIIQFIALPLDDKKKVSLQNFEHAKEYSYKKLDAKRHDYFSYVLDDLILKRGNNGG